VMPQSRFDYVSASSYSRSGNKFCRIICPEWFF